MENKNYKRILCGIVSFVMTVLLIGCGNAATEPVATEEARISVAQPMAYEDAVFNREIVEGKFAV